MVPDIRLPQPSGQPRYPYRPIWRALARVRKVKMDVGKAWPRLEGVVWVGWRAAAERG